MKIYCISLVGEDERRASILSQDFGFDVTFIDAIRAEKDGQFYMCNACVRSHAMVMQKHLDEAPEESMLLLEDDAWIVDQKGFKHAISEPLQDGHCRSLGSAGTDGGPMPFQRTHAMLFGKLNPETVGRFISVAEKHRNPPELVYSYVFGQQGNFSIAETVLVNFAAFVSSRTKKRQIPLPI